MNNTDPFALAMVDLNRSLECQAECAAIMREALILISEVPHSSEAAVVRVALARCIDLMEKRMKE